MVKVLVVLNHPNFENSFANKVIIDKLKTLIPDVEIDHLDKLYSDGKIDIKAEQEKLLKADVVIFQFPIYWFKCPYLLSKWFEDVFVHGFAFGANAYKLEGKKIYSFLYNEWRRKRSLDLALTTTAAASIGIVFFLTDKVSRFIR